MLRAVTEEEDERFFFSFFLTHRLTAAREVWSNIRLIDSRHLALAQSSSRLKERSEWVEEEDDGWGRRRRTEERKK